VEGKIMEASFLAAVKVSILAITVIFVVLVILIFTIKLLVKLIPYAAPPPAPPRHQASPSASSEQDEHVAAITATLSMHLRKSPNEFRIVNISQQ
jgi:sodium pump decarboxylase gamma subunit